MKKNSEKIHLINPKIKGENLIKEDEKAEEIVAPKVAEVKKAAPAPKALEVKKASPAPKKVEVKKAAPVKPAAKKVVKKAAPKKAAKKAAKPAVFTTVLIKAVIKLGDPSYTSGAQKWKGAAPILKLKPTKSNNKPI